MSITLFPPRPGAPTADGECLLVSRKGSVFKSFAGLSADIARQFKAQSAVLDGEIVYLDEDGKPLWPNIVAYNRILIRYGVVIEKGDRNCSAYVPDPPGCISTGATVEETKERIREAIAVHLKGLRRRR